MIGTWSGVVGWESVVAQGVRYSVAPAAVHFNWDDRLGLRDVTLWGGRVGARFGGLVSLDGYYFRRGDVSTDVAATGLLGSGGVALVDQTLDLQHFGADLRIELGGGGFHPFISGGAGVLRFEPASGPRFDQIVVKYGGGLMIDLAPGLSGQLFVENNRLRVDRYRFAVPDATAFPADPDADRGRDHLSFGAGLGIALGGGKDRSPRDRWSLASIPIEPLVGRLEYDDPSLDHQWFGGARIGVDVGQYLGIRGYYLRGFDDNVDDLSRVQSYGAEAQFNFNRGLGPAPFLIAGVGKLDFMSGFVDPSGATRSDRNLFIVGAGLGLRLSDQLRVNLTARDWISGPDDLEDLSDTGDLRHNLMLSAGLAFAIGRGRTDVDRDDDRDRRGAVDRDDRGDRDRPDVDERDDRLDREWHDRMYRAERDTLDRRRARRPDSTATNRTATFPAPVDGEIYVRYGKVVDGVMTQNRPGSLRLQGSDSALRAIVREELRSLGIDSASMARGANGDSIRVVEDSIRIARVIRETIATVDRERGVLPRSTVIVVDSTTRGTPLRSRTRTLREREPALYAGFNLDRPRQFVVGGLLDMTPGNPDSRFRFLPEIALGFGSGGTTVLLAANVGTTFGQLDLGGTTITPRARVGFGLLTDSGSGNGRNTQGVANITYGFSIDKFRLGGLGRPVLTVEHQGLDLFDSNRLLVGLSWRR